MKFIRFDIKKFIEICTVCNKIFHKNIFREFYKFQSEKGEKKSLKVKVKKVIQKSDKKLHLKVDNITKK